MRSTTSTMIALAAASLLGACGGAERGGYGDFDDGGDDAGETAAADDASRDVAPIEVGGSVSCEDPDRPGEARTRPCASACGDGVERCLDGRWQACSARQPVAEDCRTPIDDDCDGEVNEDCGECEPGASRRCPTGRADLGACRAGSQRCTAERVWGACEGAVTPGEEQCNGLDDDCDGATDEGLLRACEGVCGAGMQACAGGAWGACEGRRPSEEQCNGLDDDCDGRVDEDIVRACEGACGRGTQRCASGAWGACSARQPEAEQCNGVDDDCDGAVDEGVARACATACGAGTQACVGGAWGACSARQPTPEVCNGLDDDCNGLRDDSLWRSCSSACGAGTQACVGGGWGACSARQPAPEVCDLRDNNCDGRVDEGLTAPISFVNTCRYSRVFVAFGGCNVCRSTCLGYWLNPNASQVYPAPQNACFQFSAFARTRYGDDCLTHRGSTYVGEVHRYCNGDCQPDSESFVCNRE